MKLKNVKGLKQFNLLGFPTSDWIIFGGSVLSAYNLRHTNDLDIVVSSELYTICKDHPAFTEFDARYGKGLKLINSVVEVFDNILPLKLNFDEIMERSSKVMLENIKANMISIHLLRKWKIESARIKDFEDIVLIDNFINIMEKRN